MRQTIGRLTAELGEPKNLGNFGDDGPDTYIHIYEFSDGTMYGETNADPLTHDECYECLQAKEYAEREAA
jgi:hypothetical protein